MSKIGILSMQRIKNYGSFLQAYGLKSLIEELGHDVEFVDYHIDKPLVLENNKKRNIFNKVVEIFTSSGTIKQKLQYINYKKNFSNNFKMLGLTNTPNYTPKLDTLVIGSDEVFNCIQANDNVGYSLELFGKNNNAKKVITYAASFGNTTLEKLDSYNKTSEISDLLNDIDVISVRDKNSYDIVNKLTKKQISFNLDPVLAYDYINDCKLIPEIKSNEKYMIVYAYSGRMTKDECKYIRNIAKEKKLKIYSIGGIQDCTEKFIDCSPFEVLSYFKNAEFIITDTFHGSIFSIINNKNFVTLVRKSIGKSYGNEEKISFLLNQLDLKERIVYDYKNINSILEKEINYEITNKIIKKERKKTKEYLKNNL